MARIHPTAIVHPKATLADDVEIGPYSIVEPDVQIGSGCVLAEGVIIRRYTTMGEGNFVDAYSVLGGRPQDLKFDPATVTCVRVGNGNVFREHVTISRATVAGGATVVGNGTYWMVGAHAGHDATIEDGAILCNCAAIGGHAVVGARAFLSSHTKVHQFTWVGEGAIIQGGGGATMHLPPFTMAAGMNGVVGLNVVGMRRNNEITPQDREQVKEAFRLTYRSGLTPSGALEEMDRRTDWGQPAGRYRQFIRKVIAASKPYNRGLCPLRRATRQDAAE
jgi:UDP-N-acetylglucosamine acyltransferase